MSIRIFLSNHAKQFKLLFGIKDVSLWRKRWKKRIGKIIYHKKYNADDIVRIMQSLGMKSGSVVCIHASMMEFYNYMGSATDLIEAILKVLGPNGTLIMPAFPPGTKDNDYIFNPETDTTSAGALAEAFRKYPGVKRSCNVRHSVCAIGKYADYLIEDHTKGHDCWDEKSPYYRLCKLNGLVFNLGMPRSYMGTFHHCVESVLQYEHPYWAQFFNKSRVYNYYTSSGDIAHYTNIDSELIRKTRKKNITKFFTEEDWKISRISNLEIKVFYSNHALEKMLNLGRKGISVYYIPSTHSYKF